MAPRYEGKPLLRLLECYVLDTVDELSRVDRDRLDLMTPKLRKLYGLDGDWRSIVSQVMHFPITLDSDIRSLWARNHELAVQSGRELAPEDFARMVVDENLANG